MDRAAISTDDLIKLVLVLVVVWLALEVFGELLGTLLRGPFEILRPIVGLIVLALLILFLLDRI
jgi:hypothetical protein